MATTEDWSHRARKACEDAIVYWAKLQREAIATKEEYRKQGNEKSALAAFRRECNFSNMRARAQEAISRLEKRTRRRDEWTTWEEQNRKAKAKK